MGLATETVLASSLASELVVVQAVMLTLAVFSYLFRVLVKLRRSDCFGIDDVFALLAVICFVVIEALIWYSTSSTSTALASEYASGDDQIISRTGIDMVLFWSVSASSQLSIFWFYRFVCSGFSWAKILLTSGFTLTVSGWAAFTICDGLNFAYVISGQASLTTTGAIHGYKSFESASMLLEVLCSLLIFCIQLFRLHHIRGKFCSKPYLIVVPVITAIVIVTGVLRLVYFLRQNIVFEAIWSQIHLGVFILCTSVPVYAGLETLCCTTSENRLSRIEMWMQDVQPHISDFPISKDIEDLCCDNNEDDGVDSIISLPTVFSRRPSDVSQWSPISRKPSKASSRHGLQHGHTREIIIEPEKCLIQRAGAEFLPSSRSSQIGKGTRRLILEG